MVFHVRLAIVGLCMSHPVAGDVAKQVLNTPWWPAGTEKTAESVGILSHGFIFATAMMEYNATVNLTVEQEVLDVRDILKAGGADLEDLVDCLVNAPAGGAATLRRAFEQALPASAPALTVVEMPGEYTFVYNSVMCVAALPVAEGELSRTNWKHGDVSGVAARGLLHIQGAVASQSSGAFKETKEIMASFEGLILAAGGQGLASMIDCTAFANDLSSITEVNDALDQILPKRIARTIVRASSGDSSKAVAIRCVAAVPTVAHGKPENLRYTPSAVATSRHVFVSGKLDSNTTGVGALTTLESTLKEQHPTLSLDDVVTCQFFVKNSTNMQDLFGGFYEVFNVKHFPPPARGEYQAVHNNSSSVTAKCIAAFPHADSTSPLVSSKGVLV